MLFIDVIETKNLGRIMDIEFSVAADFKRNTLDAYDRLNQRYDKKRITETFGQISIDNELGSGRPGDRLPGVTREEFEKYVAYSLKKGINFNYSLNMTCYGNHEFTKKGQKNIDNLIHYLDNIGVGSITVAIPFLIDYISQQKTALKIKASTLCDITNTEKALAYLAFGANSIVVHESIIRDFTALKNICECMHGQVEVIANSICHKNCMFRPFHQNQCSHSYNHDLKSELYYSHHCVLQRSKSAAEYLKMNWIRPEDMHYYTEIGIHRFKIQGRHAVAGGNPVKTVEYYMKESYDGDLLKLVDHFSNTNTFVVAVDNKKLDGFLEPFVNTSNFCINDCRKCHYCDTWAEKCMDKEKVEQFHLLAREFYGNHEIMNT